MGDFSYQKLLGEDEMPAFLPPTYQVYTIAAEKDLVHTFNIFLTNDKILATANSLDSKHKQICSYIINNPNSGGMDMIKVESSIVINKPVEEVFAFTTNSKNNAKWQGGVIESKVTKESADVVGTIITDVRQFLGRKLESELEVVGFELNKKTELKIIKGPVKMDITQLYETVEEGTKISVTMEGEPGGFFKLVGGALEKQLQDQNDQNFQKLKEIMDG
jgi:uncharacterized protein YndB with AHSA1/START domain